MQDVGIDPVDDRQHQRDFEDGSHEVVAVIQQRRGMQVYSASADELPERRGVGQAVMLSEAEQAIGDAIGDAKEQDPETAVQVEYAEKLLGDGRDHPLGQMFEGKRQCIHETAASAKETAL